MKTTRRLHPTRQKQGMRKERPTDAQIAQAAVQLPDWCTPLFGPMRYKVSYGGRGASRSWSFSRALLIRAAERKTRVLCTRELQSSLRDSVHQLLRDQIDLMELPGFRVTDREIRHVNGSLFLFEGLRNNVTKIKSLEGIDICWVEEAERITKESWDVLIPTIRKDGSEIWVTFNPDQEDDATYQRFIVRPPKNAWVVKVSWEDNPWLTDVLREEKDYAYAVDQESADHVWGGNIRQITDAQILHGKWRIEEFTVPYRTDTDGQRVPLWSGPYQGMDFGFASDPFAAVRLWIHDQVLYVDQEIFRVHLELDYIVDEIAGTIPDFHRFKTRGDSARPDSISYLRRHGLGRLVGAKKLQGSVEDGVAHLRSYRAIVIHPRCRNFADEAKRYSYKVDPMTKDVLPIIIDKHNHLMDAARYALQPLIRPKRRVSAIFVDTITRETCPRCASMLPDDGICVHCGEDAVFIARAEEIAHDVVEVSGVPAHTNGNGNGNGNGKHHPDTPHSPMPRKIGARMRGLNS